MPQAALDMLRGAQWHFWGVPGSEPWQGELLRWARSQSTPKQALVALTISG